MKHVRRQGNSRRSRGRSHAGDSTLRARIEKRTCYFCERSWHFTKECWDLLRARKGIQVPYEQPNHTNNKRKNSTNPGPVPNRAAPPTQTSKAEVALVAGMALRRVLETPNIRAVTLFGFHGQVERRHFPQQCCHSL